MKQSIYNETNDEYYLNTSWDQLGSYPRAGNDKFASCIRIVDPYQM